MSQRFSPEALTQAEQIVKTSAIWDRPKVQGITIDGPTSKDLDDAIWVEKNETGASLSVHVSDVAAYVPMGSALERDAIAKVQTQYHRWGNNPMFPHPLSENRFSLQEGQLRPTLTIELVLSAEGQVNDCKIFESQLTSNQRFSYRQADAAIADPTHAWHGQLQACQQWAQRLNQSRRESGAMGGMETLSGDFLDENGRLISGSETRYHSQQVISEFMIAANTATAQWLAKADCPALYRNHTAKEIAPGQDVMLQALLVLGSAQAIRERLQNWLNRAEYGSVLVGHFALNAWAYGHFTSPIRRLPDLINHRIIKAKLHGEASPYSKLDLENLSHYINQTIEAEAEATHSYYRNKAKAELQHQLESEASFAELSPKELSRLLKHVEGDLPPVLKAEVRSRLMQEQLQILDLYLLLIKGQDSDLQHRVLAYLERNIQQATSLVSLAVTQEENWSELKYVEQKQGIQFLAWAELDINGQLQTTIQPGCASKKQTARHQACWQWLNQYLQRQLVNTRAAMEEFALEHQPAAEPSSPQPAVESPAGATQNYIGALLELCQSRGWEKPQFEFEGLGTDFVCRCRWRDGEREIERVAIATQKKRAKQQAAMAVFNVLAANRFDDD